MTVDTKLLADREGRMRAARKETRPYKPRASAADFVRAWQGSATLAEAAAAIGLSVGAARARANSLRNKGVPLKFLSVRHLDIAALSALARSLAVPDEELETRPEAKPGPELRPDAIIAGTRAKAKDS